MQMHITRTAIAAALIGMILGAAQARGASLIDEGFETDGGPDGAGRYDTKGEFYVSGTRYFIETSDAPMGSLPDNPGDVSDPPFSGWEGEHFFATAWTAEPNGNSSFSSPATLTFNNIGALPEGGDLRVDLAARESVFSQGQDRFQILADTNSNGTFDTTLLDTNNGIGGHIAGLSAPNAQSLIVHDRVVDTEFSAFEFNLPESDDLTMQFGVHTTDNPEDFGIDSVTVVPEPATAAIILGGTGGLILTRRRRRHA